MAVARRTHHNGRYAPELLAREKMRFERGDPAGEIADELGVERNSVYRLAKKHGWERPLVTPRGLPAATRLKEEAEAFAESALAPDADPSCPRLSRASTSCSPVDVEKDVDGRNKSGHDERSGSEPAADASTLDRLERAVLEELGTVEAARAQLGPLPKTSYEAQQTARTLATLTQTLQTLQRMRATRPSPTGSDRFDMPADIDAFRRNLARRIEAFVASRTGEQRADGNADPEALDAAG